MSAVTPNQRDIQISKDVTRILHVRNLPFNVTSEEMYELFGKFGAIFQIRMGTDKETKGTAYVVFEDIFEAKVACEKLVGYNISGRYLVINYFHPATIAPTNS